MRYSILALLCITAIAATAFLVLLRVPILLLAGLYILGWLMVLLGCTLAIMHTTGRKRALWTGFAIFGWVYIMAFAVFRQSLPTSIALDYMAAVAPLPRRPGIAHEREAFIAAGHCLWSLIFAGLGGVFNSYLWSRNERRSRTYASSENPI